MLKAALALVLTALLASPAIATAQTPRVPQPANMTVIPAACPTGDAPACAYQDGTIYIEPGQDQFVYWHEVGHIFDAELLTVGDRNWFTRMLGLIGAWDQGSGLQGLRSPKERFADAYATCALGWRPDRGPWADSYGYEPTLKRHKQICAAINRIGERA